MAAMTDLPSPVRNKFVFFVPIDPRVCNFYSLTRLTLGYVQNAVFRPIDSHNPRNPWRHFDAQWLPRDFLLGDKLGDVGPGFEVWAKGERNPANVPGLLPLPSGRVVKAEDPWVSSWYQYRCDIFEPMAFPAFEEGLKVALECLSVMPGLPSPDVPKAVEILAELVHLGMGYDNPEVEEKVLWGYLDRVRADPEKAGRLKECGNAYAYLATLPYEEVRQVVDDCIRVARGEKAGEPRILPAEVPAVADLIRANIPRINLELEAPA